MTESYALQFSHMGLFVIDIDRMADFYSRVLGFAITDRGGLGETELVFLSRDPRDHHQIVLVAGRPAGLPDKIVNQISFRVGSLAELQRFYRRIRAEKVAELIPICHGNAWSVYFRDPEGNRLEVFVDTDWYITQPIREVIDLDLPEDELRRRTEAFCRTRPGFKPIREWQEDIARRIAAPIAR
jgi:catechol 2,3-dioxygenase